MSTNAWSEPAENLLDEAARACDVLVIGSGYGGSVAASQLANGQRKVWVLERGREYALGEFPEDIGQLPGHVRLQRDGGRDPVGTRDALFDVRSFEGGAVLLGSGLGGGSLINAGVALQPSHALFRQQEWPQGIQDLKNSELDALFAEARRLLGADPLPDATKLPKFQALARLARARGAKAEPVPITVAGTDLPANGERPVDLKACIRCGNCFTGCNYGAKRTLATNLIPAAVGKGARFFTGAQAMRIEERADGGGARYRVHFRLVADRVEQEFAIDARTVVVSAGTLGSTELLMRSHDAAQNPLKVSPRIGERFSGNGDAIALGWGQRRPVQAFAHPVDPQVRPEVGPTITGVIRTRVDVGDETREALIQDGAVPHALGRSALALGSSLSLFHRYLGNGAPAFFDHGKVKDWVASPLGLRDHTQVLLAMGADEANGKLEWAKGQLAVKAWPKPAGAAAGGDEAVDFQEAMHQWFRSAGRDGFDGGDYLANPMFRALPDDFAEIAGAGAQAGARITVHPLGGCAMGDDVGTGVVDQFGTVFRPGGGVYDGLHVLDGSIIPCATVANPLLTISALALRAARHVDLAIGGAAGAARAIPATQPAAASRLLATGDGGVELEFRETLAGAPDGKPMPAWLQSLLQGAGLPAQDVRSWVGVVEVTIALDDWLENPSRPLPARLALWASREPVGLEVDLALTKRPPLLQGQGTVSLLALDEPGPLEALARLKDAVDCFSQRRPGEADIWGAIQRPAAALATATNHTLYRELRYDFQVEGGAGAVQCSLGGVKKLAYATGARNLWDALLKLPLELRRKGAGDGYAMELEVDLVDMIRKRRLQVTRAPSTPAAIVGLASFTAQWARALVQTHFWSFRGLTYDKLPPPQAAPAPPATLEDAPCRTVTLRVPKSPTDPAPRDLELHEYKPAGGNQRCILLIHGLAHGSGVFTTDTVTHNLASHFLRAKYTVWLLDHRLSNRLPYAAENHTIDDVARYDVSEAIRRVHKENGNQPIEVFAHCVGAAAFSMAVLRGNWGDPATVPVGPLVRAAIIHAVHPWVVPSVTNRTSAALAALYKDLLPTDLEIDPIPTNKSGRAMDEVIDRIAATLPWPDEEREPHERGRREDESGYATCNRMTLFYGREWRHGNLDERTHERLRELVGVGGLEVFRQLFFIALRRRLTDRAGENVYLTQKNFNAHWGFPTLFAHGGDNRVFDVRSAVQSWKRLTMVHALRPAGPAPVVGLFVPKRNCGHMDFLFGTQAPQDVYPALTDFLAEPGKFQSTVQGTAVSLKEDPPQVILVNGQDVTDHVTGIAREPLCGPMVQVDQNPNGRKLVLWCEQGADATSNFMPPGVRIDGRELEGPEFACVHSVPSGAGTCWVIVVAESAKVRFDLVTSIELELRYDGRIPYVNAELSPALQADLLAGLKHGWFHKVIQLGTKVADSSKAMLLPQAANLQAKFEPRPQPDAWRKIDITGLRWWQRWAREKGGPRTETAFLATSCRWPGLPFEREAIHRLAVPMLKHVELPDDQAAQGLLLLGDQIYVDATANVTETTEPGERGPQRYRDAFDPDSPSGKLLGRLPVWMVVDDHEFGDDLGEFHTPGGDDENLTLGFAATVAFQWRHKLPRPRRWITQTSPGTAMPAHRGFWYPFEIGGLPAFAADTRTERESRRHADDWRRAEIMSAEQAMALEHWLLDHRHEPKLLCSGSVFGLPTRQAVDHPASRRHADDWSGFPASCDRLVQFIVANDIRNLVFVSGDYHFSAMACLRLEHGGKVAHAVSVASSGWNATLPFANAHRHDYAWEQPVVLDSGSTRVVSHASLLSTAARQFSKVTVTRVDAGCAVKAEAFDVEGVSLKVQQMQLPPTGACA